MELDELKQFLRIDGDDMDIIVSGYQTAAETYLSNAGVTKDYTNGLYKIVIASICGLFVENPSLIVQGKGSLDSLSITLQGLITQLRLSQVVTTE